MENKACAFEIELSPKKTAKAEKYQQVKKRLEASLEKAAKAPSITLDQIEAKLAKAEENRKQHVPTGEKNEERLQRAR